jgi:predicted PurR-regulated permease PerM
VGPFVAYISTISVCILNGDWKKLIIALIVLLVLQTIDGNVINPKLLSANISIHPMLVIASLIIGSAIGGIIGMLLAVPVGALIKIQFERGIDYLMAHRHQENMEEIK